MAALSITPANVKCVSGVHPRNITFGVTVVRGKAVFKDSADSEYKLADCDDTAITADSESVDLAGVAGSDGADGTNGQLFPNGATINIGATTVAGVPYCLGSSDGTTGGAAGDFMPYADLSSDDTPVFAFWGTGTAVVTLDIKKSPVALA